MQQQERKINTKNLTELCWRKGFRGVPALARHVKRARSTIWRAVRWPDQFGPTYQKIQEALSE